MLLAAVWGQASVIDVLVNEGASVELPTLRGHSPVMKATAYGYHAVVVKLLEHGADPDARVPGSNVQRTGYTPLLLAAELGHSAIVELLLDSSADIKAADNHRHETALMMAARKGFADAVDVLARNGAELDARDITGGTALGKAAHVGSEAVVETLLYYNASTVISNVGGGPPLTNAAMAGHSTVVQLLLAAGADAHARDSGGYTPEERAKQGHHHAIARMLRHWQARSDDSDALPPRRPWQEREGQPRPVTRPVGEDPPVASIDKNYGQPHTALMTAVLEDDRDEVDRLMARGAAVDAHGAFGDTALMTASDQGRLSSARLLLARGADVNRLNYQQQSALALASHQVDRKLVGVILQQKGVNVDAQDRRGLTALMQACKDSAVRRRPRAARAHVVKRLLEAGVSTELRDNDGYTALHHASVATEREADDTLEVVQALLAAGANVLAADQWGQTPHDLAKNQGNMAVADALRLARQTT